MLQCTVICCTAFYCVAFSFKCVTFAGHANRTVTRSPSRIPEMVGIKLILFGETEQNSSSVAEGIETCTALDDGR